MQSRRNRNAAPNQYSNQINALTEEGAGCILFYSRGGPTPRHTPPCLLPTRRKHIRNSKYLTQSQSSTWPASKPPEINLETKSFTRAALLKHICRWTPKLTKWAQALKSRFWANVPSGYLPFSFRIFCRTIWILLAGPGGRLKSDPD